MEKHDFSVFNHPRIFFAERIVPREEVRFFEQNDLKTSRDFLIDYIWIGEDRYFGEGWDPPNNTPSIIRDININWQIVDRATVWPMDEFSVTNLQNYWDADRSWNPCAPADTGFCSLLWRHALRWIYNPTQDVRIDWEAPGVPNGAGMLRPQLTIRPSMSGTSLKTGHRRVYGMDLIFPAQINPQQRFSGTASAPNTMGNLGDDPYAMEDFGFSTTSEWDLGDLGWFNLLRMKVIPSQGEAWSDVPIPLAVYALHQSISARRWVVYKPPGGPLLLKAGQSFVARVRNTNGQLDTQVQIALIGRTAPGIGSMGMVG